MIKRIGILGYAFVFIQFFYSAAWAGGEMGDGDKRADEGPHFFGFVKDDAGKPIPDAKVTAAIKGGTTYIMRTPKTGLYRFGGLSKAVKPDDVTISCAKEGYKQMRTFRRPVAKGKDAKAVETDCRMQKA
ncbi:MAG TPA: carboxypeptidase-like regulatory domain-containing protein [Burkholderiales bacterium]|nr:carboxypeptidase-like regulatory domain-containing protein [Burkholderiales bacterium]